MKLLPNISMDEAANRAFRDGVKGPAKLARGTPVYFDDGKTITTTFRLFCAEIATNVALFRERPSAGTKTLSAYSFNLVAGQKDSIEVLATLVPLSEAEKPNLAHDVYSHSGNDLKRLLRFGESVLLKRGDEAFAVMHPAEKYVEAKIQREAGITPTPL